LTRLLILNNVRSPSFDPLFSALARKSAFAVEVCYLRRSADNVGWSALSAEPAYRMINVSQVGKSWIGSMMTLINRRRADFILIYGYSPLPQATAILLASARKIPFGVIGDANIHCDHPRPLWRTLKRWWLRYVARRASVLFPVGAAGAMFWERYGGRAEQMRLAPYTVDNDFFARESVRGGPALRLIFVGRLIRRKNVHVILDAIRTLPPHTVTLTVIGEGPERGELERMAASVPQDVRFLGRVAHEELPQHYAASDALVLPAADEPWGLVINEAMASGLAVITHRHVGAAADLVSAENGVVLDTFDPSELNAAIARLANQPKLLQQMKDRSRARISRWTIDDAAQAITAAVGQVMSISGRSAPQPR
jgi:glycosyltransferase involved in cell wall biosynthesis